MVLVSSMELGHGVGEQYGVGTWHLRLASD